MTTTGPAAASRRRTAAGREHLAAAAVLTVLTGAAYMIGSGRNFSFDASITVGKFVVTPSLLDPFHRHDLYNNHVLLSFLDHVVYTVTGSTQPWVLRLVPVAASALAVGVVTFELGRRFGTLPGVCGGVLLASNPLLVEEGREIRGYSLLVLCAAVSTALLFRLLRTQRPSRLMVLAYVAATGAGILTHLYGLLVVVLHVVIVVAERSDLRRWGARWVSAVVLGVVPAARVLQLMSRDQGTRGRHFAATFPAQLARELLGRSTPAWILLLPVTLAGAWFARDRRWLLFAVAALVAVVLVVWAIAPLDLYPRFFIWLLPGVGYLAALAVRRQPALALLVVASIAAQWAHQGPDLRRSNLGNRQAAAILDQVSRRGGTACALDNSEGPLLAYVTEFIDVRPPGHESHHRRVRPEREARGYTQPEGSLAKCDVLAQVWTEPYDRSVVARARKELPYVRVIPALDQPTRVYSRVPLRCWLDRAVRCAG